MTTDITGIDLRLRCACCNACTMNGLSLTDSGSEHRYHDGNHCFTNDGDFYSMGIQGCSAAAIDPHVFQTWNNTLYRLPSIALHIIRTVFFCIILN